MAKKKWYQSKGGLIGLVLGLIISTFPFYYELRLGCRLEDCNIFQIIIGNWYNLVIIYWFIIIPLSIILGFLIGRGINVWLKKK